MLIRTFFKKTREKWKLLYSMGWELCNQKAKVTQQYDPSLRIPAKKLKNLKKFQTQD